MCLQVPHKVKGSGVVKPAISDWKAVLKKQRRGKETSAPVTVDALQGSVLQLSLSTTKKIISVCVHPSCAMAGNLCLSFL